MNYERIQLGEVEKGFIFYFSLGPTTAYNICLSIESTKALQKHVPVSYENVRKKYKNVYKRVVRLYKLGLIEEVVGNFPRGAKPYRLTSHGLFEYLLLGLGPSVPRSILDTYKDDVIIEYTLYRYFELDTLKEFRDVAMAFVGGYLRRCCESILRKIEGYRYTIKKLDEWKESGFEYDLELLSADIDQSIRDEIRTFSFQIATSSNYEEKGNEDLDSTLFPVLTLVRDKKFMKVLGEIKDDFDTGCKNFGLKCYCFFDFLQL
jgi:hypothetical protein